jgi:hypothetical protein
MNWIKSNSFLVIPFLGLILIAGLIHFTLFDGIHVGEVRGVVEKVYIKSYPGWRVGGSSLHKAKVELESGDVVAVICEAHCKYRLRIKVQVYEPIFSANKIYIYKNIYPY